MLSENLKLIDLKKFKNQVNLLDEFVTDPQWCTMLKYDMALNLNLANNLTNYILYIQSNDLLVSDYENLINKIRIQCVDTIKKAESEKDIVKKWLIYREAYAYYGFIETITEGSIITDRILNSFSKKYGDTYLETLKRIDNLKPSILTNFSNDENLPNEYKSEEVQLYLLMKHFQDDQHLFHENILYPAHQKARKDFEKIVKEEMPELNDVCGKNLIALYLLNKEDIVSIEIISRFVMAGLDKDMALIIGGKNLGLSKLKANGFNIPETFVILVNSLKNGLYVDKIKKLSNYSYSVRSSATTEDNENQSFAGMFMSVLDVAKDDLLDAIEKIKQSVNSDRVLAYSKHFATKNPEMSVVLQKFKEPEYSGVWIGNDLNTGYLEWTEGNGEKLVSGKVKPTSEYWPLKSIDGIKVKNIFIGESCLEVQKQLKNSADLEWCVLDGELVWLQYRPVTKTINKIQKDSDKDAYIGIAASTGIVKGKPIYLEDVNDEKNFEEASILLTDYTDPEWVPIILRSSAIITAEGGFLSHTAIISRELGIPCVTGLGYKAIFELSKADMIEVNGNSGKVKTLQIHKIKK